MRYRVDYLAAGERATVRLEATDAASAVAAVAATRGHLRAFELLAVAPVSPAPPAREASPARRARSDRGGCVPPRRSDRPMTVRRWARTSIASQGVV